MGVSDSAVSGSKEALSMVRGAPAVQKPACVFAYLPPMPPLAVESSVALERRCLHLLSWTLPAASTLSRYARNMVEMCSSQHPCVYGKHPFYLFAFTLSSSYLN